MKFGKVFLTFLFLSIPIFTQDGAEYCRESKIRQFNSLFKADKINYPGDSNYDVTYYKLDLALTYSPQNIIGAVTVNATIKSDNISSVFLDLTNPLIVDSVILNSSKTSASHVGDSLIIDLKSNYNTGDKISIVVFYHGIPGSSGFGSFTFGTTPVNNNPTIYTLSEPYGAKDWWPCKDTPADKADSADIWITVVNDFVGASNGTLLSITDNGNGTHTYKWKVHYAIAQYLLSLAIADYYQYVNYYKYSPSDSMRITNYVYPESWNSTTKSYLDLTPQMIKVFAEHFGEYPFLKEKYGHAQFGWGGGMEHQTLTSLGGYSASLISHELTHMWYGDAITCKDWHHIWLNEGFATYGQGVWIESQQGKSGYDNFISAEMNSAKNAIGTIWVQDISSVGQIFDGSRSYAKGGVVLHMLRGIVGDSIFYEVLRAYSANPALAYGVATTEDFQAVAQNVSGMDLNYFFQEWIYGENYPQYSIVWSKNYLHSDLWNLSLRIDQQTNTSNPTFFTMPVQIKVNFVTGDTLITIFNNTQAQNFSIAIKGEPTSITFDPNNWIMKNVVSIILGVDNENIPNKFSVEQNFPNPFNPSTQIQYSIGTKQLVQIKIYDVLGNEVATLVNEEKASGTYEVNFDAANLPSGVYIYKMQAGSFFNTRKMILLK
jgi:aminopeptidase N